MLNNYEFQVSSPPFNLSNNVTKQGCRILLIKVKKLYLKKKVKNRLLEKNNMLVIKFEFLTE